IGGQGDRRGRGRRTTRLSPNRIAGMIEKQEAQEIFPTPLWVVDLQPAAAAALNAGLKAEIERIIEPRPAVPVGSNWQTPHDLHTRPAFAEFVKLVETVARGVARHLQVDQYPIGITGCWANVNPPSRLPGPGRRRSRSGDIRHRGSTGCAQ